MAQIRQAKINHQKAAKLHPKLVVDFQNTAITVPEEPQIPTNQPQKKPMPKQPPTPPHVILIYCFTGKTNMKI